MSPVHVGRWWRALNRWLGREKPETPDALWHQLLQTLPFVRELSASEQRRLRALCQDFLACKEFYGAHGLRIRDDMALSIAAQACLPLLHWGSNALDWYSDFVGIVVHPDEVVAAREVMDEAGVVHHYKEPLLGEAMAGGPVMLTWRHVALAANEAKAGRNLVIHEFAHKLDMHGKAHDQPADGCPRLPAGFMNGMRAADAKRLWRETLHDAHESFRREVAMAERFGAPQPWLDNYGAQSPAEFFAVACEAFFTDRHRFAQEFPAFDALLDAFFRPTSAD